MIRLAIVVEGETEEEFVKSVLAPHLQTREVEATPHLIGGNVTVERPASEMANLFWSYDRGSAPRPPRGCERRCDQQGVPS